MVAIPHSPEGFPMAPSQSEWDRMTPEERDAIYAALPGEVTDAEISPPEGELHFTPGPRSCSRARS